MRFLFLLSIFLAALTAGCSVHPVQDDVTRVPTLIVVQAIRCEARNAIIDTAIRKLKEANHVALATKPENSRDQFFHFDRARLVTPDEFTFYDRYIRAAIALEFTFDISEDDNANTRLDLVRLLTNGSLSIPLAATNDRMRQNTRKFIVSNTFKELLDDADLAGNCRPGLPPANLVYPITGRIGLLELLGTFIDLNEEIPLVQKNNVPVFADTLIFTTTVSGSVSPLLTLAPIGRSLQVASAGLSLSATRKDVHQLVIGLSLEPGQKLARIARTTAGPFGSTTKTVFSKTNISSDAEYRAIEAIVQQRIDTFFDRFGRTTFP